MEGHGLTPDVICYNAAIKAAAAGAMMTHTRGSRRRGGGSASGSGGGVGGGGGGDKGGGSGSGDGSDGNSASDSDSGGGVDDGGGKGGRGGGGSGGGGGGGGRRRWEIATGLLREMSKKGVTPNEVSYTSAMIACKNDGEPEEALALLREMSLSASEGEEEGGGNSGDIGNGKVVPNVIHYTTVMSAFAERGDGWRKAMGLIKTMEASGIAPNTYTYNAGIKACGKDGRWAEAVAMLREMPKKGVAPDELTLLRLLSSPGDLYTKHATLYRGATDSKNFLRS
eukprot:jgi/Undpi1/5349/HiC_scaffold_2.g00630.m1